MRWAPAASSGKLAPALLRVQIDALDRHVPMGFQDFETPLFFSFVGVLVGGKLLYQRTVVSIGVGDGSVLENDRGAIVPPAVLGRVISRGVREDLQDAAHLDLFF